MVDGDDDVVTARAVELLRDASDGEREALQASAARVRARLVPLVGERRPSMVTVRSGVPLDEVLRTEHLREMRERRGCR